MNKLRRSILLVAATALAIITAYAIYVPRHPVRLAVIGRPQELNIRFEGTSRVLSLDRPLSRVRFPKASPLVREYQIDGTDSTNNFTLDRGYIQKIRDSLYYQFVAALRDEESYSRWRNLVVRSESGDVWSRASDAQADAEFQLPIPFTLTVELHRIEVPAVVVFVDDEGRGYQLTIDRNAHAVILERYVFGSTRNQVTRWYFPQESEPFFALSLHTLAHLVMYALVVLGLVFLLSFALSWLPHYPLPESSYVRPLTVAVLFIAASFAFTLYITLDLYNGRPHIFDSIAYYFQGKIFARGWFSAPPPPDSAVLGVPFLLEHNGRWFAKYAPGNSLLIALGMGARVPWLVGPLLGAGSLAGIYRIAGRLYGHRVALLTLFLMILSPFYSFMVGTYLSHATSLFFLVLFLLFLLRYYQDGGLWNLGLSAAFWGSAVLTREASALLFAVPFLAFLMGDLIRRRGWQAVRSVGLFTLVLLVFGGLYLAYNLVQTGDPFTVPRLMADPTDRYGFGRNVGFYGRHTLAAGLLNLDQLLTILMIDLYGWPFYFALVFPLLVFLTGRANRWDALNGVGVLAFFLGYIPYFYHGIVYGPRYYYEALPMLVMLTARGIIVARRLAEDLIGWLRDRPISSGWAVYLLLAALVLPNLFFYMPRHIEVYDDFTGIPWEEELSAGEVYRHQPENAVVLTDNRWVYINVLSVLNCPSWDCSTVYAFAANERHLALLHDLYPNKRFYRIQWQEGEVSLKSP